MMKKIYMLCLVLFALLLVASIAFAQGRAELTSDGTHQVEGFAPRSITLYPHTKANVTVTVAATGNSTVSKYCAFSTKALTVQFNGTGDARTIPANTDYCRTVRKGVTSLVFGGASSASTNIQFERQY
jgi:hypothetical protein